MRAESLFGPGTILVEAPASLVEGDLLPAERAFVAGAAPARRAEYGTARVCARAALARIGVAPAALVSPEGRGPGWPDGAVGSIAHTHGHCAVVVGARPPLRAIGLDVELLRPLEPGVVDSLLTSREHAWFSAQPRERQGDLAVTFFCAKEAYYKCQHPLTGTFLDFADVEVELDLASATFEARGPASSRVAGVAVLGGRFAYESGRVFCGVELRG